MFFFLQVQYEEICQTLSVGMNVHLKKNYLIRDLFDLGAPLLEEEVRATLRDCESRERFTKGGLTVLPSVCPSLSASFA